MNPKELLSSAVTEDTCISLYNIIFFLLSNEIQNITTKSSDKFEEGLG